MNLAAFQHNVLFRLSTFVHRILNNENSPQKLKEMILNKSSSNYITRSSQKAYHFHIPLNHYGQATCHYFFPKFITEICMNDIYLNDIFLKLEFLSILISYIQNLLKSFLSLICT